VLGEALKIWLWGYSKSVSNPKDWDKNKYITSSCKLLIYGMNRVFGGINRAVGWINILKPFHEAAAGFFDRNFVRHAVWRLQALKTWVYPQNWF